MPKFYLRQTVPFNIKDMFTLFLCLFAPQGNEKTLKKEIAKITQTKYVLFAESMRSILVKSLEFFKIKEGTRNEILLPEYSFHSNLSSAIKAGFKVKFVPVNQETLLIDETKLEKLITKKTLGIAITHVHGKIYDLGKIQTLINKYKLIVFEDCAHSFPLNGSAIKKPRKNNLAIKCLSFGPGKLVTAFGGGALATNNKELFEFVESQLVKNESPLKDLKIFVAVCLYTLITNPLISYFTMKPILALTYLLKMEKHEAELFDKSVSIPKQIKKMSNFQQKILLLQLKTLNSKLKKVIVKRRKNAQSWSKLLEKGQESASFCFQFPIAVNQPTKFIWQMWQQNIDVQKDYCTYLPTLMKSKSFSQKKADFFSKLVYLPTNQYLSSQEISKAKI